MLQNFILRCITETGPGVAVSAGNEMPGATAGSAPKRSGVRAGDACKRRAGRVYAFGMGTARWEAQVNFTQQALPKTTIVQNHALR